MDVDRIGREPSSVQRRIDEMVIARADEIAEVYRKDLANRLARALSG